MVSVQKFDLRKALGEMFKQTGPGGAKDNFSNGFSSCPFPVSCPVRLDDRAPGSRKPLVYGGLFRTAGPFPSGVLLFPWPLLPNFQQKELIRGENKRFYTLPNKPGGNGMDTYSLTRSTKRS